MVAEIKELQTEHAQIERMKRIFAAQKAAYRRQPCPVGALRTWRRCARCAASCLADIASAHPRAFLRQPEDLDRVEKRLKSINTLAPILRCERANVSVDNVLNICGFDLDRTLEMDPEFLNTDNDHEHDDSVSSVSFVTTAMTVKTPSTSRATKTALTASLSLQAAQSCVPVTR